MLHSNHSLLYRLCLLVCFLCCLSCSPGSQALAQPQAAPSLDAADPQQRLEAIQQLLRARSTLDAAATEKLQSMCEKDKSPDVRAAACVLLAERKAAPDSTIPVLISASADTAECEDGRLVANIASAALAKFETQPIPRIRKMLQSGDRRQVITALFALDKLGPFAADVAPDLLPLLEQDEDLHITRAAINAVIRIGAPTKAAVPELIGFLDHENFHIRYWSCRALGSIGPAAKDAVPRLLELLREGRVSVRRHAAAALGKIGVVDGQPVVPTLIAALDDPLQPVKIAAVVALGELAPDSKAALPVLKEKLRQKSFNVRAHAAMTWWRLEPGSKEARKLLLESLHNENSPYEAVEVIDIVGAEMQLAPDVAKALDSDSPLVREAAAMALASLGEEGRKFRDKLAAMAETEPDHEVRELVEAIVQRWDEAEKP